MEPQNGQAKFLGFLTTDDQTIYWLWLMQDDSIQAEVCRGERAAGSIMVKRSGEMLPMEGLKGKALQISVNASALHKELILAFVICERWAYVSKPLVWYDKS